MTATGTAKLRHMFLIASLRTARCVDRLLHNWDPLASFFCSEKGQKSAMAKAKAEVIHNFLKSRTNQLRTIFLSDAMKLFQPMLVPLQAEEL
ncbi:hypothetical protein ElyMa_006396500 [Elysia marginata]|uniref:Uncharacterized protein n=1 Tax=Elysia marginata TaxID=1093978 RepID=A0AAV4HRC6_9GAST|nr:hypothetical protein ElyMa_006396500 [Elysia marginata]